jgi:hypothetical protein
MKSMHIKMWWKRSGIVGMAAKGRLTEVYGLASRSRKLRLGRVGVFATALSYTISSVS